MGGKAYGMPRYSETLDFGCAAWPWMRPEVVLTGWPTCQVEHEHDHARVEADIIRASFMVADDGITH